MSQIAGIALRRTIQAASAHGNIGRLIPAISRSSNDISSAADKKLELGVYSGMYTGSSPSRLIDSGRVIGPCERGGVQMKMSYFSFEQAVLSSIS
jgi:hypothetical protein